MRGSIDARRLVAWLALVSTSIACGAGEDLGASRAAIYDGTPAPEQFGTVAVVNFADGLCSGSLIAPNLVLTARHCIAGTSDDTTRVVCDETTFEEPESAGAVFVVPLPAVSNDPADYRAVGALEIPLDAPASVCGTDVALLTLKGNLNIPTLVVRVDAPAELGEPFTAVGYGLDEGIAMGASGVRRRLEGREVFCATGGCEDPEVRPNEWVGTNGVCSGDSGGPALDAKGRVFGVVSRGKSGCREPVYADVHAYADWLKVGALRAAQAGGYEAFNWARGYSTEPEFNVAVGARCEVNTDCPLGFCGADLTCSRACTEDGPCPSGYSCASARCVRDAPELGESCAFHPASKSSGSLGMLLVGAALSLFAKCRRGRRAARCGGSRCSGPLA